MVSGVSFQATEAPGDGPSMVGRTGSSQQLPLERRDDVSRCELAGLLDARTSRSRTLVPDVASRGPSSCQVPVAATRPDSSSTMRSAASISAGRWATATMVVRPRKARSAVTIRFSVEASS